MVADQAPQNVNDPRGTNAAGNIDLQAFVVKCFDRFFGE